MTWECGWKWLQDDSSAKMNKESWIYMIRWWCDATTQAWFFMSEYNTSYQRDEKTKPKNAGNSNEYLIRKIKNPEPGVALRLITNVGFRGNSKIGQSKGDQNIEAWWLSVSFPPFYQPCNSSTVYFIKHESFSPIAAQLRLWKWCIIRYSIFVRTLENHFERRECQGESKKKNSFPCEADVC